MSCSPLTTPVEKAPRFWMFVGPFRFPLSESFEVRQFIEAGKLSLHNEIMMMIGAQMRLSAVASLAKKSDVYEGTNQGAGTLS